MLATIAAIALVAGGVGVGLLVRPGDGQATSGGPGVTTGATAPGASAEPGATGGPLALATPSIVDGAADLSAVVAPLPDDGEDAPYERTAPATGKLTLGAPVELASQPVGAAGGSVTVAKPGDPLDGLRLDIPAGAFGSDRAVTITERPVDASSFPALVTPASPLVTIDDGGGYADQLLTLRIPAKIPDGAVAGAFYYDETTGRLEGLPLVAMDATGLTVTTRHFSSLFAAIATGGLPDTVDSGFRPGIDDWQFVNRGSYIEPGGHCSGQVVSAMYYYTERRLATGASPLYDLYDNNGSTKTPDLWEDDSDGYRLASMVQHDTNFKSWAALLFENSEKTPDSLHRMALRYAMAVTGEPQEMFIYDKNGGSGHAIAAYRVTPTWVMVADPNFPGKHRGIRWNDATQDLKPYTSGTNAVNIAQKGVTVYEQLLFAAKSAVANWGQVGQRWADFDSGVVGDGTFPKPTLEVLAGKDAAGKEVWARLVDGYLATDRRLTIRISRLSMGASSAVRLYPGTAATPLGRLAWRQTIDLDDGANPLGFAVFGMVGTEWQYVDFVRVTVNRGDASPSPTMPAAGGRWELVSSGKGTEFATTGSISDGRLDDPDVNGYSGSGSWPAPPSVLTPGQAVAIALSTTISPSCDAGNADAWGLDGVPARDHRMILTASWKVPYGPDEAIGTLAADCLHAQLSQSFDWVAPERRGDTSTLGLTIRGGVDMGDRHAYEYVYEWRP